MRQSIKDCVDDLYYCFQLEKAASGAVLDKDMEHIIKTQELLFKRQLKQYSSKVHKQANHFS